MIEVESFSKYFGDFKAVNDLSFSVSEGEIFAFLGANGSGKTTTIRALLNIYQPDHGTLLINGSRYNETMAPILGYLPEERGLYVTSRVLETLVFFGEAKGLSNLEATKRANEYLEQVGLGDKAQTEIKKLSSGQQQKIQLGLAIINRPQLLILDEPTKGLDPINRTLLMDMLLDLNRKGSTVVFITHQMEEVERIADRLVMIKNGKRILYGGLSEVKSGFGSNTIHLVYEGELPRNDQIYTAKAEKNTAEITPINQVKPDEILSFLVSFGLEIKKYEIATPSLDEIFIEVSKEENA